MPRSARTARLPGFGLRLVTGWLLAAPFLVAEPSPGSPVGDPPPGPEVLSRSEYRTRLEALRREVELDRYDVGSRVALADFLDGTRDIELRREASEALREALLLEPGEPDLWIRFARLQERRGFHDEADDAYRSALERAPDRWDVWDLVAQHEFNRFQRQLLWGHFEQSRVANAKVLRMKPDHVPAVRRGLRLAMIRGETREVDSLCTVWERSSPGDPWAELVRGMLLADARSWEQAEERFRRAIDRLPEEERRPFFRLDRVDPREEDRRTESPDTLRFFEDYWRWRDPTPADGVNPRLVEHYRRMMQAELLFALESLEVRGWEHAPGEMIVRYGLPGWWTFLGGIARVEEYRVSSTMAAPSIEMIFGDGPGIFPLLFVDYNLNGRYYYPIEGFPLQEELDMATVPSTYTEPFAAPELDQAVEVWRFVDPDGGGRLEIGVALDPEHWPAEVLDRPYRLSSRLRVYDADWSSRDGMVASWAPFTRDPFGRLIARFELAGTPDSLILGLETVDRQESARAAGYAVLEPSSPAGELGMSDLAFLTGVTFADPAGAYGWSYGSGIPNPGHLYRPGDPVGIAFEAYGLVPVSEGAVTAKVRVTVSRETRTGWLRVVLGGGGGGESELVFEASEPGRTTLFQVLSLELPGLEPGKYLLRAQVEDLGTGRIAERSGIFRIQSPRERP